MDSPFGINYSSPVVDDFMCLVPLGIYSVPRQTRAGTVKIELLVGGSDGKMEHGGSAYPCVYRARSRSNSSMWGRSHVQLLS